MNNMKINIKSMLEEKNNEWTPKNEENSKETIPTEKIENSEVQEQKEEAKKVPKLWISTLQNKNHSKIEEEKKDIKKETKNEENSNDEIPTEKIENSEVQEQKKETLKSEEKSGQSEPEVKKPKININMNNKNIQREAVTEKKEEPTDQEKFEELKKQSEINKKNEDDEDLEKFQNEFFSDEKKEEPKKDDDKKEKHEELFSNYVSGYDQKLEKYEEKEVIKLTKKVKTLMRVMYSFIFVWLIFWIGLTNYLIYDFSKNQESDLNDQIIADNRDKNQKSDNSNQDDPWWIDIDELTSSWNNNEEDEDLLADTWNSNSWTWETDDNWSGTINNQDLTREEINQIVRENLETKIKNIYNR